jgi:hypothetical protein
MERDGTALPGPVWRDEHLALARSLSAVMLPVPNLSRTSFHSSPMYLQCALTVMSLIRPSFRVLIPAIFNELLKDAVRTSEVILAFGEQHSMGYQIWKTISRTISKTLSRSTSGKKKLSKSPEIQVGGIGCPEPDCVRSKDRAQLRTPSSLRKTYGPKKP